MKKNHILEKGSEVNNENKENNADFLTLKSQGSNCLYCILISFLYFHNVCVSY